MSDTASNGSGCSSNSLGWVDLSDSTKDDEVIFKNVSDFYSVQHDIVISYEVTESHVHDEEDYLGIFPVGFEVLSSAVIKKPADPNVHTVTFEASSLPNDDRLYQFLYIKHNAYVGGASASFKVAVLPLSPVKDSTLVIVDDFLVVPTVQETIKNYEDTLSQLNSSVGVDFIAARNSTTNGEESNELNNLKEQNSDPTEKIVQHEVEGAECLTSQQNSAHSDLEERLDTTIYIVGKHYKEMFRHEDKCFLEHTFTESKGSDDEFDIVEEQNSALIKKIAQIETEKSELEKRLEELKKKAITDDEDMEEKLKISRAQSAAIFKRMARQEIENSDCLRHQKKLLKNAVADAHQLKEELDNVKEQNSVLTKTLEQKEAEKSKVEEDLKAQLVKTEMQMNALIVELNLSTKRYLDLNTNITQNEEEKFQLYASIQALQRDIAQKDRKLQDDLRVIMSYRTRLQQQISASSGVECTVDGTTISFLRQALNEKNAALLAVEASKKLAIEELIEKESQHHPEDVQKIEQLTRQHQEEVEEIEQLTGQHEENVEEIEQLTRQHREHVEQIGKLTRQHREHVEQIEKLTRQHHEDAKQIEVMLAQCDEDVEQMEKLTRRHHEDAEQIGGLMAQSDEDGKKIEKLTREHDNDVEKIDKLLNEVVDLFNANKGKDDETQQLKSKCRDFEQRLELVLDDNAKLNRLLTEENYHLKEQMKDTNSKEAEITFLTAKCLELEDRLKKQLEKKDILVNAECLCCKEYEVVIEDLKSRLLEASEIFKGQFQKIVKLKKLAKHCDVKELEHDHSPKPKEDIQVPETCDIPNEQAKLIYVSDEGEIQSLVVNGATPGPLNDSDTGEPVLKIPQLTAEQQSKPLFKDPMSNEKTFDNGEAKRYVDEKNGMKNVTWAPHVYSPSFQTVSSSCAKQKPQQYSFPVQMLSMNADDWKNSKNNWDLQMIVANSAKALEDLRQQNQQHNAHMPFAKKPSSLPHHPPGQTGVEKLTPNVCDNKGLTMDACNPFTHGWWRNEGLRSFAHAPTSEWCRQQEVIQSSANASTSGWCGSQGLQSSTNAPTNGWCRQQKGLQSSANPSTSGWCSQERLQSFAKEMVEINSRWMSQHKDLQIGKASTSQTPLTLAQECQKQPYGVEGTSIEEENMWKRYVETNEYVPTACPTCGQEIFACGNDISLMMDHMEFAHRQTICPICQKVFGTSPSALKHFKYHVESHFH